VAFLVIAALATRRVGSLDIGFHLKAGERFLQGYGWPATDPFTFTVTDHPYIDSSWGYQVLAALVYAAGGPGGLVVFHLGLVLAVFALLYRSARLAAVDSTVLVVLVLAGGIASEMRFEARPELLSWLFLAGVLHILHRRALRLPSPLWMLATIHLAWANAHSLFVLGWGALACFLTGTWLETRRLDRGVFGWSLASIAATFVNPYGWRAVLFPFTLATRFEGQNLFRESIGEFISPFALQHSEQFPFYPRVPITVFRILTVLALVALVPLLRSRRFFPCLLCVAFLPPAALMIRNMPLLVIAVLPGTAGGLSALVRAAAVRHWTRTWRVIRSAVLTAASIAAVVLSMRVVHDGYYIDSRRLDRFGFGWNRLELPVDAVRAVAGLDLRGRVLNHLNFGGYLVWAGPGPVFIDGRLEVMGEDFYAYYREVLSPQGDLEACVARYGIGWIIFPHPLQPGLLVRLSADPRWRLAYVDHLTAIFARNAGAAQASSPILTEPVSIASLPGFGHSPRARPLRRFLSSLWRSEEYPSQDFYLGLFHYDRGELEQAERRFAAAIRESGGSYFEIYTNLCAVLYAEHRFDDAAACHRAIAAEYPGSAWSQAGD
jgi:hypothetical protein